MQMCTGTRLTTAIHRRLLSRIFLREGGRLYTSYTYSWAFAKVSLNILKIKETYKKGAIPHLFERLSHNNAAIPENNGSVV